MVRAEDRPRHAVDASEVAAIGDADAQVVQRPAARVEDGIRGRASGTRSWHLGGAPQTNPVFVAGRQAQSPASRSIPMAIPRPRGSHPARTQGDARRVRVASSAIGSSAEPDAEGERAADPRRSRPRPSPRSSSGLDAGPRRRRSPNREREALPGRAPPRSRETTRTRRVPAAVGAGSDTASATHSTGTVRAARLSAAVLHVLVGTWPVLLMSRSGTRVVVPGGRADRGTSLRPPESIAMASVVVTVTRFTPGRPGARR